LKPRIDQNNSEISDLVVGFGEQDATYKVEIAKKCPAVEKIYFM
jgi:hypothetical protein